MEDSREQRPAGRYRFGVFEADAATGELRRKGIRVRLSAQPFQLLLLLLDRPGELITRDEISRELWPDGTFVDFDHGVNSAINRIREALGDSAGNPRFVETLARRGYRLVAPVERIAGEDKVLREPAGRISPQLQTIPQFTRMLNPNSRAGFSHPPTSCQSFLSAWWKRSLCFWS